MTMTMTTLEDLFGPPISVYTRKQALEDGSLVAFPEGLAREAGIMRPIAATRAAWAQAVDMTPAASLMGCDLTGRMWDVLWLSALAARGAADTNRAEFTVAVVRGRLRTDGVELVLEIGPDDDGEPVFTVMLPGED